MSLSQRNSSSGFPNSATFSNVVLAWAKNKDKESAEKAHEMLLEIIDHYHKGNFPGDGEPELIAFNGVLSAYARCGRAEKAEEVLWLTDRLSNSCKFLAPDVVTYNTVLHSYIRCRDKKKALDKILSITEYMDQSKEEKPEIKPDGFTYSTILKVSDTCYLLVVDIRS